MKKRTTTSRTWECLFSTKYAKAVDPLVDAMWKGAYGEGKVPFGDLRNQWRRQHCRTLNPYGSESCPYPMKSCAEAFLETVSTTIRARARKPVGYFRKVAKNDAAKRADEKPLSRDLTTLPLHGSIIRTGVPDEEPKAQGPGDAGASTEGTESRQTDSRGVRSTLSGPIAIGDLLGSLDLRSRQGRTPSSEEGNE